MKRSERYFFFLLINLLIIFSKSRIECPDSDAVFAVYACNLSSVCPSVCLSGSLHMRVLVRIFSFQILL